MEATITKDASLTGFSREAVEALSKAKGEPAWVLEQRLKAWAVYENLPFPARTDEEWRRTDIRGLKLDKIRPFAGVEDGRVDSLSGVLATAEAGGVSHESERAGVLVQRDAATIYSDLSADVTAKGVIFTDLDTAVKEHPELVKQYFMTKAVPAEYGKYEALHGAFWQGGSFLYVPKGVTVELPFRSFTVAQSPESAIFTHTQIVLEEGAEAFLVDSYRSESLEDSAFASGVIELFAGKHAQLRYVQVQDWGRHVWNFMTERAVIEDNATLRSLHVTLGSKFTKNSISSQLIGQNSLAEMLGIFFADGDQFFDHHTWQLHESPYATSDLEFKGALKDSSRSVYSGLIKVSEGAQRTDAYQQNRNLVLSRNARADTIPNLEIGANDVRCTHGATVSQVEEEHIFYLQARGIPRTEAQKLIVEGFFRPVIDRIPVEEIQGFLEGAIARKVGY
jgi:Fe-S cluster assembly protein SufD